MAAADANTQLPDGYRKAGAGRASAAAEHAPNEFLNDVGGLAKLVAPTAADVGLGLQLCSSAAVLTELLR